MVARRRDAMARRGRRAAASDGGAAGRRRRPMSRLLTFERLKIGSFTHSAIYAALLVVWLVPGLHREELVLGLAHGIGWIAMSAACLVALRARVIDLRLAVAVAV